ncbi:MAG: PspA/IM30 family protein [Magnetococcus sp. DMHC-1]|nr:PspA/IM30 family protein [Magnetococcales bacterium]
MGLFAKIVTAVRGGAREVGESIVDANSVRIFEQEIHDAENHLQQARRDLTQVMAKEMEANRESARLEKEITEHEGYVAQALAKGNETLALEVAQRIADLQVQLADQKKSGENFVAHAKRLKEMVLQTERSLVDLRRQLVMVKTTESVQKATQAITDNYASTTSRISTAKESLDRIRNRQQELDDRLKAGETLRMETTGEGLQERLKQAGIGANSGSAADILARIKSRQQPA